MERENKKGAVAALHRERIMRAAQALFSEQGYVQTTIDDISKASEYSRRTIYAYYESKEDILLHIVEEGLRALKADLERAVNREDDFVGKYNAICLAMSKYQRDYPYSAQRVNRANSQKLDRPEQSDAEKRILRLGTEINAILADFLAEGKACGMVRKEIVPMLTVYVFWSSVTALLTLADTQGPYICKQFSISKEEFLDYGFRQLLNSILEVRF